MKLKNGQIALLVDKKECNQGTISPYFRLEIPINGTLYFETKEPIFQFKDPFNLEKLKKKSYKIKAIYDENFSGCQRCFFWTLRGGKIPYCCASATFLMTGLCLLCNHRDRDDGRNIYFEEVKE
jgi:hypothetical protein